MKKKCLRNAVVKVCKYRFNELEHFIPYVDGSLTQISIMDGTESDENLSLVICLLISPQIETY